MPFECKYILWSCNNVDKLNFANEIVFFIHALRHCLDIIFVCRYSNQRVYVGAHSFDRLMYSSTASLQTNGQKRQPHSTGFLINWTFSGPVRMHTFWPVCASHSTYTSGSKQPAKSKLLMNKIDKIINDHQSRHCLIKAFDVQAI